MLELTILMPCLNEARTVGICINKALAFLKDNAIVGEILISDNGSSDGSQKIARDLGANVVDVPMRGYGAALIAGIHAAKGKYIIMGDSDDSYDFSNLGSFVKALRDGHDLVMGNRFRGGIESGAMPKLHRYLGNPVLSGIGRLLFQSPIKDFHCGLRGFNRQAMVGLNLHTTGMEFASEMVVKATLHGLRIAEVPTTLKPDGRGRPPHLRSWRDGWRHLKFLLLHSPKWLFFYPGLFLLIAGSLAQVVIFSGPITIGSTSLSIQTMLYASVASVMGLQLCLLALIGVEFSNKSGVSPNTGRAEIFLSRASLERGLIFGGGVLLLGCALALRSVFDWAAIGFGGLSPEISMRLAIPAAWLILSGSEIMAASFFLALVRIGGEVINASKNERLNPK
jgi:glycosyltransferase involved in cell wall biosynthesis